MNQDTAQPGPTVRPILDKVRQAADEALFSNVGIKIPDGQLSVDDFFRKEGLTAPGDGTALLSVCPKTGCEVVFEWVALNVCRFAGRNSINDPWCGYRWMASPANGFLTNERTFLRIESPWPKATLELLGGIMAAIADHVETNNKPHSRALLVAACGADYTAGVTSCGLIMLDLISGKTTKQIGMDLLANLREQADNSRF